MNETPSKTAENCKKKTAAGNVFPDLDYANAYAMNMQRKVASLGQKTKITAYLCSVCGKYHVGGEHGRARKREYRKWDRARKREDREGRKRGGL